MYMREDLMKVLEELGDLSIHKVYIYARVLRRLEAEKNDKES